MMTSEERDDDFWVSPYDARVRIERAKAARRDRDLNEFSANEVDYEEQHRRDYFEEIQGEMEGTIREDDPFAEPDESSHERWAAINETC